MEDRARLAAVAAIAALLPIAASAATTHKKPAPAQPPGGTNQVEGTHGKIGDMLFDGQWRFQVKSVETIDTYTLKVPTAEEDYAKYTEDADEDPDTHTFTPKAGYTFVTVDCLVKNAQRTTEQLDCYLDDPKTAVTDDQSGAYPPIAYDMQTKGPWMTKSLLPGSGEPITVLFAVPIGTKLQDLVFTLKDWSSHTGHEVRVSLTP
jgi:hypothetical protein